jgi:pimeloyl-ACP methyl ester carboxylesterase
VDDSFGGGDDLAHAAHPADGARPTRRPGKKREAAHGVVPRRRGYRHAVTAPLSLTRSGAGEPLLLLHGWGSSHRDFTAVLPELSERFDVLNVELPGAGRSRHLDGRPTVAAITDAVEHTLDAADVGAVHVLGNSLGARIGLELARRGRARSVVAIAPWGLNVLPERIVQGTGWRSRAWWAGRPLP